MKSSWHRRKIVCLQCYYSENKLDCQNCEMCGASLKEVPPPANQPFKSPAKKRKFKLSKRYALLALILLATAGGFYFYRTQSSVTSRPGKQVTLDLSFPQMSRMKDISRVPKGFYEYAGATTFAAVNTQLNRAIQKDYPQFELHYHEPDEGNPGGLTGMRMLLNSEIAFSQMARPLKQKEYDLAKSRGFGLKQVPVAIDGLVLFVNPALKIEKLSLDRVRDIYSGKITNWKQVGGPDLAIVPISINPKSNIALGQVMEVETPTIGKNVKSVRDYTHALRQTAATPGAISFASAALVRSQHSIKPIALAKDNSKNYVFPFVSKGRVDIDALRTSKYPLTRRMFIVYRLDGTLEEKAGTAYANLLMTTQGQQLFKEAGFAPLYTK
jgi:phosphate transport system substrate-binding protein